MEEEDGGGDFAEGSSPRITSRNKKVYSDSSYESDSDDYPKKNNKRKRGFSGKKIATKKQNVGFKCCPHMLYGFLKQLTDTQRKWADDLGFGALLLMPDIRLPKDLTLWLINQVDWKRKALMVRGKPIKIKRHVKKVLDIPDGPFKVGKPPCHRGRSKIRNLSEEEKQLRDVADGCGKSLQTFTDVVLKLTDEDTFKRWFMLVILCVYLAPTSSHFINRNYMPYFVNLDIISQMDWCGYIANYLIDGIREYRDSTAATLNVHVHGCVHILLLIYISLVRTEQLKLPQQGHLSNHCTTDILHQLEAIDLKHNGKNGAVFGILDVDTSGFGDENSSESGEEDGDEDLNDSMPSSRLASDRFTSSRQNTNKLDCRRPTRTSMNAVGIKAEMDKIETDHSSGRNKVYQHSFDYLRENVKRLDHKRSAAIKLLLAVVENSNSGCSRSNDAASDHGDSDSSQIKTGGRLTFYNDNNHESAMTPSLPSPRTNTTSAQGADPAADATAQAEKGTAVVQASAADHLHGISALSGNKRNREEAHAEGPCSLPTVTELLDAAQKADALREEEMKKTKAKLSEANEAAKVQKENADDLRKEMKMMKAQLSEAEEAAKLEKQNADALREELKNMKAQLSEAKEAAKLEKQNADALREELKMKAQVKVATKEAMKEIMEKFREITSRSDL